MNIFFQFASWSFLVDLVPMAVAHGSWVLTGIAAVVLYVKMSVGFSKVASEFTLVRGEIKDVRHEMEQGFLKVNHHLENHDREIKQIKKRLKSIETSVFNQKKR